MEKFRNLSINVRVPLMMGITSLAVLAVVCLVLSIPLRRLSLKDSTTIARLSAMEAGERLSELINGSAIFIRSYSDVVAELTVTELVPNANKREILLRDLDIIFKSELGKKMHDLWLTLEPNVLDGMDSLFINRTGSNSRGVFAPWFTKDGLIISEDNDQDFFYSVPKETRRELITDLYWDRVNDADVQMFSICRPVLRNGEFLGVFGTDIYVNDMMKTISELNSGGLGQLVSDKGVIMVHYDRSRIGQLAGNGNREILDRLSERNSLQRRTFGFHSVLSEVEPHTGTSCRYVFHDSKTVS